MPTYNEPKSYSNDTLLTEAELDEGRDYRATFLNTTKLDSDNIQTGGVATANIADLAITSGKIAADAVTTAKILDANVTAGKLASNAVTTAKINDGAVTQAKRAALGQQVSSSCGGAYSNATGTPSDVTNLSISITTTGRPVQLILVADGSANASFFGSSSTSAGSTGYNLRLQRGGADIAVYSGFGSAVASGTVTAYVPASSFSYLDVVAAGTYTYKIRMDNNSISNTTATCRWCVLVAYEL